ncbi:MAG: hypothetical protein ACJA0U_002905 [Salibacteraceae bacterium]|jgi:hypothetical protein
MKTLQLKAALLGAIVIMAFNGNSQSLKKEINSYLSEEMNDLGLSKSDIKDWVITSQNEAKEFGITYVYTNQQYLGIEIYNAINNYLIKDGKILLTGDRFERNIESRINTTDPVLSETQAIQFAAKQLEIGDPSALTIEAVVNEASTYTESSLSRVAIPVKLVYAKNENGDLRLAWDMSFEIPNGKHYWSARIDAVTGALIDKTDWTVSCDAGTNDHSNHSHVAKVEQMVSAPAPPPATDAYNVFALPVESPNHGSRAVLTGPSDPVASPFGWHDTDGNAGEEYTITRGNNVYATEDSNDDNNPGYAPDGGPTLNFDFPFDPNQVGQGFWDPAITNLFYMNNRIHDVLYRYGFDEASGNFQENNYGSPGQDSDGVNADAQDGSGTNNANFSTPPDGSNPRMQMYLWGAPGVQQALQINSPASFAGIYAGRQAVIGTPLPFGGISGNMVIYDDGVPDAYNACEPAINAAALNGNIAVIRRSPSCDYVDQMVAAEDAGAIAVIVVNTTPGALAMGGTDPGIGIPGIMITMADGEAFITEIETNGSMNGTLDNYGPFPYDSDLDNGIISHEYGHGVSNRLTAGGNNTGCLGNDEQMGEGWSDYIGLILTMEPGDLSTDVRGIGTYVIGESTTGPGIRPAPYSTDWTVNNFTYANTNSVASISQPHGIGFIWCTMLWDLTWKLIDVYGYDPDIVNGNGGNNTALQLVMNGMKIQPCSPGFIDGRDAILSADQALYNGANQCLIWEVFANRGCGFSADQGSSNDRTDQVGAFDLPPAIDHTTTATFCQEYTWAENGVTYTQSGTYTAPFTPQFGCDSVATLFLTITPGVSTSVYYLDPITLQANAQNATYQWMTCIGGIKTPIPGETNNVFNVTSNGLYAVEVTQGNCVDTSNCLLVNQAGIEDTDLEKTLDVYPNPTSGGISIDFNKHQYAEVEIQVLNSVGQVVQNSNYYNTDMCELKITNEPGIYFVRVTADNSTTTVKVVKQN